MQIPGAKRTSGSSPGCARDGPPPPKRDREPTGDAPSQKPTAEVVHRPGPRLARGQDAGLFGLDNVQQELRHQHQARCSCTVRARESIMAKGNNAQGKDRKKAKAAPKKTARAAPRKAAAPKKKA